MTAKGVIRVMLVDDHMVVRRGLVHVLENDPGIEVVAEAASGEDAIKLFPTSSPDLLIMDIKMDGMGGVEATRSIVEAYPQTKVIGLSSFLEVETIQAILSAGASGFLPKDVSASALVDAIYDVMAGRELALPKLERFEDRELERLPEAQATLDGLASMGRQQRKVLALLTKGFTNQEIAEHLEVSLPTARYHVSAILNKLDVSNRAEAAAFAIRNSLVSEQDFL